MHTYQNPWDLIENMLVEYVSSVIFPAGFRISSRSVCFFASNDTIVAL